MGANVLLVSLLTFTTVIFNLYSGVRVYLANRAAPTNRMFLAMCLALCIWGLGYTFMISADTADEANRWRIVSAVGWCFLYPIFVVFTVSFTGNRGLFRQNAAKALLFVPAAIFFANTVGYPDDWFVKTAWGWMYPYSKDMHWHAAFAAYYSVLVVFALWLIHDWGNRSKARRVKRQARIMSGTIAAVYLLGAPVDTFLPMLGYEMVPVAIIFSTIFVIGLWYSITRYRVMMLNFRTAAEHILANMADPVLLVSEQLVIEEVNAAAIDLTGYQASELIGRPFASLLDESAYTEFQPLDQTAADGQQNLEICLRSRDSRQIPCLLSVQAARDEFGDLLGYICLAHNIEHRKQIELLLRQSNEELERRIGERTAELELSNAFLQKEIAERKAVEAKIEHLANHDHLTGLPNRRMFQQLLERAVQRAEASQSVFAVLFLDLDNFKFTNDTFGHTHGDAILAKVSERFSQLIRAGDTLARIGGDEFMLLVEQLDRQHATQMITRVLEQLQREFRTAFRVNNRESFIAFSVGIAIYPEDGADPETLVKNADIAMYEAKYAGKNVYRFCSPLMKQQVSKKSRIRSQLNHAIERNELLLHYQPLIDLTSNRISGFEALLRWNMNQEGLINPEEFIPLAEETGIIIALGDWVAGQALAQLKQWQQAGYTDLRMAINLSAGQLLDSRFLTRVTTQLQQLELDPACIEFEITERIACQKDARILATLELIKAQRINITIDDFGTDFSSFMNLKLLPLDRIKIAKPFVSGIEKNEKDAAIVSLIIALSKRIDVKVIAEGVETQAEVDFLRREGCDEIQGFYYYQPLAAADATALLADGSLAGLSGQS